MSFLFQKVPEASAPSASLDEALSFHGFTRALMSAEMMRWIDSIRLESPELYRTILYDPPDMKRMMGIKTWDFVISTGMTTDYPLRRGWNDFMGIREFVQNALDIEERVFGYEGIEVGVHVDKIGLHISDRGPGISYEAFRLGGTDKKCWERGYYGEGLKVAMAYFAYKNLPVYVFNRRGQVYKSFVSPGTNLVLIAIGRANPVTGTEVIVYGLPEKNPKWADVSSVKRIIFKEWLRQDPSLYILTTSKWMIDTCKFERPNFIVAHSDRRVNTNFLWVRDIAVNNIDTITGSPSVFGYNLWWVDLEPNRITVTSVPELGKQVARGFDTKAVKEFLDRVVVETKIKRGLFETELVDWWATTDEAKEACASWVKDHKYGFTTNERALDWALYLGVKPLIVPYNMKYLFGKAQTLEDVIIVKGIKRIAAAEKNAIPLEELTLRERCNMRAAEIIMENIHTLIFGMNKLAPSVITTREMIGTEVGTVRGEEIYILRDTLETVEDALETVLHEYAHYWGKRTYGEARDLSEAFERALGGVATQVAFISEEGRRAFARARHGAWNAKNIEWEAGRYRSLPSLSERFLSALKAGIRELGLPPERVGLSLNVCLVIDYSVPLIVVISLYSWQLTDIKRGGFIEIKSADCRRIYYIGDILDWDLPYARLDLYQAAVSKTLKEVEEAADPDAAHIILLYNPDKDNYEVWKVIPRQTSY